MLADINKKIIETDYCDKEVLGFVSDFFGDEITIFIDIDGEKCWKISFLMCSHVQYDTDAAWGWRKKVSLVRNMNKQQLGYYCQEISVMENTEAEGFYDVHFDLSIITGYLTCKDIVFEQVSSRQINKFWEMN
ncbi:hypothetical protein [Butyrivibrio sp. INlla21]|uniref:hypothetical protein n=1 Tax=Butyrivibrio sp. INlla21 TaxID=1520811 RepID=UPI0008E9E204|nr:hypothetical protein [Butyrivibrio sp. INlla21]SFU84831.1 hypothetical protein SAMN02910342_02041 [Butyrivibrio sp. INlla21]